MRPSWFKVRVKLVLGDAIAIIDHCDGDSDEKDIIPEWPSQY